LPLFPLVILRSNVYVLTEMGPRENNEFFSLIIEETCWLINYQNHMHLFLSVLYSNLFIIFIIIIIIIVIDANIIITIFTKIIITYNFVKHAR